MNKTNKANKANTVALYAVLTALAMMLGYIERLMPFWFGVPGVKLGLANLAVIIALYTVSVRGAAMINFSRIFLNNLLFGSALSLAYSLAGGMLSLLAMTAARRKAGAVGVGIIGGVTHNVGQIAVAVAVTSSVGLLYYLPVLIVAGGLTGAVTGVLGGIIADRLQKAGV